MALPLSPERSAARWWAQPSAWEVRWQLEAESMRRDSTIAQLTTRVMRRMPDVIAYAERHGLYLWDLLAYSANAESADGRLRLVAVFPGHPYTTHPDALCLDGPRLSKHRNPPFDDGVFGKSAELCLYYRKDPVERRWRPENGLLGLFDIARLHIANEHEWRRTRKWPGEDAPHGESAPAPADPTLSIQPISPRNMLLHYQPPPDSRQPPPDALDREAA
jgi:hypothetical protein